MVSGETPSAMAAASQVALRERAGKVASIILAHDLPKSSTISGSLALGKAAITADVRQGSALTIVNGPTKERGNATITRHHRQKIAGDLETAERASRPSRRLIRIWVIDEGNRLHLTLSRRLNGGSDLKAWGKAPFCNLRDRSLRHADQVGEIRLARPGFFKICSKVCHVGNNAPQEYSCQA